MIRQEKQEELEGGDILIIQSPVVQIDHIQIGVGEKEAAHGIVELFAVKPAVLLIQVENFPEGGMAEGDFRGDGESPTALEKAGGDGEISLCAHR